MAGTEENTTILVEDAGPAALGLELAELLRPGRAGIEVVGGGEAALLQEEEVRRAKNVQNFTLPRLIERADVPRHSLEGRGGPASEGGDRASVGVPFGAAGGQVPGVATAVTSARWTLGEGVLLGLRDTATRSARVRFCWAVKAVPPVKNLDLAREDVEVEGGGTAEQDPDCARKGALGTGHGLEGSCLVEDTVGRKGRLQGLQCLRRREVLWQSREVEGAGAGWEERPNEEEEVVAVELEAERLSGAEVLGFWEEDVDHLGPAARSDEIDDRPGVGRPRAEMLAELEEDL